jgi:hypothetical protein
MFRSWHAACFDPPEELNSVYGNAAAPGFIDSNVC